MKVRHYLLIYSFFFLCFVSVALTRIGYFDGFGVTTTKKNEIKNVTDVEESFFKSVEYFLVEKKNPIINFNADTFSLSKVEEKALSTNPNGVAYRVDSEEPIHFQSKLSKINLKERIINLDGEVITTVETVELKSDKMKISINENLLFASGNVKTFNTSKDQSEQILINANSALYRPKLKYFEYRDGVSGTLKRQKAYEESVKFSSDSLDFNGLTSIAELKGNVHLMRDNYDVYAALGSIFLENYNKKLKYYSFSDDVRLEERVKSDNRIFTRKAFSEKLEGVMSEKKIILTGLPKVFQDRDVIKGNRIVIRENVETVEVDDANTNITLKKESE